MWQLSKATQATQTTPLIVPMFINELVVVRKGNEDRHNSATCVTCGVCDTWSIVTEKNMSHKLLKIVPPYISVYLPANTATPLKQNYLLGLAQININITIDRINK